MRRRLVAIRSAVGLGIAGALVGLAMSAFGGQLLARVPFLSAPEISEARQYMVSLLTSDEDRLAALRPKVDVVSRAVALAAGPADTSQFKVVALRFVGGTAAAGEVIQFYVVEYHLATGQDVIIPYTLTLMGGKVVAVE
jgi:hypothetical protein